MKPDLPSAGSPAPTQREAFRGRFLSHVHRLVEHGHRALGGVDYSQTDEVTISGDICEKIEELLDSRNEPWMPFYDVHNEKPVQQTDIEKENRRREGKSRPIIDIEIVSSEPTPRLRFSFEAKRLRDSSSVSAYVGREGMGCFVGGLYASRDEAAGMLGFVQSRTIVEWMENIERKIKSRRKPLGLSPRGSVWRSSGFTISGNEGKRSLHKRVGNLPALEIFHSFLDFRKE